MKSLTSKQAHITQGGRFLLGVFAVAWLNLAVQPCLMAMEAAPESVVNAVHPAQVDHASHSPDHSCDHCPPASSDHAKLCASAVASDCSLIPDLNSDGHKGPTKLKDIPTYVAIADLVMPGESIVPAASPIAIVCAASGFPGEPPLTIRFCVFLK